MRRAQRADRDTHLSGGIDTLPHNYNWIALAISLPNISRWIGIDPLEAGTTCYLLWMIHGFLVVTSVLVISLGRLGDIKGKCGSTPSASQCSRSSP